MEAQEQFQLQDYPEGTTEERNEEEGQHCECATEFSDALPYTTIYDDLEEFQRHGYFVPTLPVIGTIVNAKKDSSISVHPIDKYVYRVHAKHGHYEWHVQRRFSDFRSLNNRLKKVKDSGTRSPFPRFQRHAKMSHVHSLRYNDEGDLIQPENSAVTEKRTESIYAVKNEKAEQSEQLIKNGKDKKSSSGGSCKLAPFPKIPDSLISEEKLEERKRQLQQYLSSVLRIRTYRNQPETARFLGVSRLSFVQDLGSKYCEGACKERPGGERAASTIRNCCLFNCCQWKKRWLVAKDNFVALLHNDEETLVDVILYDPDFRVTTSPVNGDRSELKGVRINNLQRDLLVKCRTAADAEMWMKDIWLVVREKGNVWLQAKRFGSSFPERDDNYARWFVDGRSLMEGVADAMEAAEEEIFITNWWLTPHIYMKRPMADDNWRLDQILKRKAAAGVRIFVLVYKEVTLALGLNSQFTEDYLISLHPLIKVLRHPDHYPGGIFTWAHHEKTVIIDQIIAFVGGIDLCYGRWDDHEHRLTDIDEILPASIPTLKLDEDFPPEYYSSYAPGVPSRPKREAPDQDIQTQSLIPDHVIDQINPVPSPFDLAEAIRMRYGRVERPGWEKTARRRSIPSAKELWPGKDYVNFIHKDIPQPEKPFEDFIDRMTIPRLPWHDIAGAVCGSAARDVARHFIQRWNAAKLDAMYYSYFKEDYPLLIPKSYDSVTVPETLRQSSIPCNVQVLRSVGLWSSGISATENSIQQAYLEMIRGAKHYVYIENQFFVSQLGGSDVLNQISNAIFDRIVMAHRNKETFRVYIVMPLLPAFEKESGSMQVLLYWTYASISKGPRSLLVKLEEAIGDPSQYISICSLRTHSTLVDKLVTELIYIHSKLIIVDDRYCLIGSANINDRSQMGDRDSEVAIHVTDTHFTPSQMNGAPYEAGLFASTIRKQLFHEHLGLIGADEKKEYIEVNDPITPAFFDEWNNIAKSNTEIYEKVFACAPSDSIRSIEQMMQTQGAATMAQTDQGAAAQLLTGVQGYLVQFPTQFLADSELMPSLTTPEGLMPTYIFV